jgi:hypothetical protein
VTRQVLSLEIATPRVIILAHAGEASSFEAQKYTGATKRTLKPASST